MSHFSVIVVGEDVEGQLQPFHEYECTGVVDEHVVFVDEHDEVEEDWNKLNGAMAPKDDPQYGGSIEAYARDYHGYHEIRDGRIGRLTNPNAKWDWWVEGGRWASMFNITSGMKSDFDLAASRKKAEQSAIMYFDAMADATKGIEPIASWADVRAMFEDDIEKAREYRNSHPWINAIRQSDNDVLKWARAPVNDFVMGRDAYIESRINSSTTPWACVMDGKWYEKGEMGWFGMSHNEQEQDNWNEQFINMLSSLPSDTLLTVVDCHI